VIQTILLLVFAMSEQIDLCKMKGMDLD